MTDLYRQACSFLSYRSLSEQNLLSNSLLQETLAKRNADKAYLSHYMPDAQSSTSDAVFDANYYYFRFRDTYNYMNHYLSRQKRSGYHPVGDAAQNLDRYYIAQKLQLLCEMVNVRNVMSVQYDFFMQDEIIKNLKAGAFADVPLISIYFRILMTLSEPDDESHFYELRILLRDKTSGFSSSEVFDMFQYLMNYCIRKINLGNTGYVNTLFEIYQLVLERKIIYRERYLSQWDFKNIVVIGLRAIKNDWVKEFIEKYKNDLPENERANAHTYNLAYYYFGTGNYHKAISMLQKVEFTDLYYQLDTRAILLKCYYELDDEETLLYHLAAFRIFLSRNKLVSDYQRTLYRNLIRYTTKLTRIINNKKQLEVLLKNIEKEKQVADLGWLKAKIVSSIRF